MAVFKKRCMTLQNVEMRRVDIEQSKPASIAQLAALDEATRVCEEAMRSDAGEARLSASSEVIVEFHLRLFEHGSLGLRVVAIRQLIVVGEILDRILGIAGQVRLRLQRREIGGS